MHTLSLEIILNSGALLRLRGRELCPIAEMKQKWNEIQYIVLIDVCFMISGFIHNEEKSHSDKPNLEQYISSLIRLIIL